VGRLKNVLLEQFASTFLTEAIGVATCFENQRFEVLNV
jgi:hypothetical protein